MRNLFRVLNVEMEDVKGGKTKAEKDSPRLLY